MQVVSRSGGRGAVTPYEAAALKDVVYLGRNEQVDVIANFAPWSGLYMFHCHNLVHEDHDMMAAFNVSEVDLSTFGYPQTVSFNDPMEPLFRAKSYSGSDMSAIQDVMLPGMQNMDAYPDAKAMEKALDDYYKNPPTSSKSSSTAASTTTTPSTLVTSTISTTSAAAVTSKATTTKSEDKPKTTSKTTAKATTTKKK